jgi:hypothetical protein
MTSKIIALKVLDGLFVAVAGLLSLTEAGVPSGWLLRAVGMTSREFQAFALFILFGTLLLIQAIATSDSAP